MRFSFKINNYHSLFNAIDSFFHVEQIEQIARQTRFITRQRKMTGIGFFCLCVFGVFQQGLSMSLGQLCTHLYKLGISISTESLNERFNNKAVRFMKNLFESALCSLVLKETSLDYLNLFNGVYLQDSTHFQLPGVFENKYPGCGGGASTAGLKLDLINNYQNGASKIVLRSGNTNDYGQTIKHIAPGSLWLRDMGYFEFDGLEYIDQQGGYYISRHRSDVTIYEGTEKDANRIELTSLIADLAENQTKEMNVYLGYKKRFPVRLIIEKLPNEIANQKKHKLITNKQHKRKTISERRLILCHLNMFITNIQAETVPATQIMQLYRVRWQIELIFKIWKSHYQIHTMKKMKLERMECHLYGRLILILMNMMIVNSIKIQYWNRYGIELSDYIAHKYLRECNHLDWFKVMGKRQGKLKSTIRKLFYLLGRYAIKSVKKKKLSPLKISLT